ncbi:NUDIX domain-containing protein [Microbacterium sp. LRZ72]|uniref:8-oxo-dGTP diphosphatase n=1 Tax=Microbacterium sp. LRZ72 TaxID=2942481 RepID=UPI0029BE00E9|nr:NUDIX domain-containing protein [Microbacterium sp. LRZ72]MDX2376060.1 NUDIX domain-containing protein [Microbacterium sp. LRZ72]
MVLPEVCVVYLLRPAAVGEGDVLLGYKRTGLGLGKVVGIGGKVEPGESVLAAAVREMREETTLEVRERDLEPAGVLDYHFPSRPTVSQRSHVFTCTRWRGEPAETDEIVPRWFGLGEVPYERMWDDASRWLPGILRGGTIQASYTFGDDLATVVAERRTALA